MDGAFAAVRPKSVEIVESLESLDRRSGKDNNGENLVWSNGKYRMMRVMQFSVVLFVTFVCLVERRRATVAEAHGLRAEERGRCTVPRSLQRDRSGCMLDFHKTSPWVEHVLAVGCVGRMPMPPTARLQGVVDVEDQVIVGVSARAVLSSR